jgi:hypothetical protein
MPLDEVMNVHELRARVMIMQIAVEGALAGDVAFSRRGTRRLCTQPRDMHRKQMGMANSLLAKKRVMVHSAEKRHLCQGHT